MPSGIGTYTDKILLSYMQRHQNIHFAICFFCSFIIIILIWLVCLFLFCLLLSSPPTFLFAVGFLFCFGVCLLLLLLFLFLYIQILFGDGEKWFFFYEL